MKATTGSMSADRAREVIASHLVASAVRDALSNELVRWEDFPDIGEFDWAAIETRMDQLIAPMSTTQDRFTAAYEVLAGRANEVAR